MILANFDGVQYAVTSDSLNVLHNNISTIRADIKGMQAAQSGNNQKWFYRKDKWDIKERDGKVTVVVYGEEKTIRIVEEKKIVTPLNTIGYVLLVEMGDNDLPGGFAVFKPNEQGGLDFDSWTNAVSEINKDPVGCADQETFRAGWASVPAGNLPPEEKVPGRYGLEQCKRVDQGYLAYEGDSEIEECTECHVTNELWTYEDIVYPTHWVSVEPGPPPPAFCGYTWTIPAAYGGGGSYNGETEHGTFHDNRHLFYAVYVIGTPVDLLVSWWPPEFNQKCVIYQYWNLEGCITRMLDSFADAWDSASDVGIEAAVGDIMMLNSLSVWMKTNDVSKRIWGNMKDWGNFTFALEDTVNLAADNFPYTSYVTKNIITTTNKHEAKGYLELDGVYVKDDFINLFIQGHRMWLDDDIFGSSGRTMYKRLARAEDDYFIGESYPRPPLTDRQKIIIEGNEEAASFVFDPYTENWIAEEGSTWFTLTGVYIMCGGISYLIFQETGDGGGLCFTGYFSDYGIFTKKNTGVDDTNRVDASKVEPIYAYSVWETGYNYVTGQYTDEVRGIIYGMVLDGVHYKTEEFGWDSDNWKAIIPGTEDAIDKQKHDIKPTHKVRIAYRAGEQYETMENKNERQEAVWG